VDVKSRHLSNSVISLSKMGHNEITATVTLTYENLMDKGEMQEQKEIIVIDSSKTVVCRL
jgi:hypothetical protein